MKYINYKPLPKEQNKKNLKKAGIELILLIIISFAAFWGSMLLMIKIW